MKNTNRNPCYYTSLITGGLALIVSAHLLYALTTPSIYRLSQSGSIERLERMIERGANVNSSKLGYTPLHIAAQNGNAPAVSLLIRAGARLDDLKDNWESPLHSAIRNGNVEPMKEILEAGANPNISPNPPLVWAIQRGQVECALVLLDHGAEAAAKDADGVPALFYAILLEDTRLINALIEHGASLSQLTSDGESLSDWLETQGHTSAQTFLDSLKDKNE